jgi:quercetin dioxygenase-like cupin family protein
MSAVLNEQPAEKVIEIISHHFAGGIYLKEMRINEGYMVKQHKHEYDHLSFIASGCAIVEADGKQETHYGPKVIVIPAGVEHSVTAVNGPVHWSCIHATDCTDVAQVDEVLIEKKKEP